MTSQNTDTALCFIFNHPFTKNIAVLKRLYEPYIKDIFFLVPFEQSDDEKIITIYRSSHNFQGFITDACDTIMRLSEAQNFIFCADDLLVNPKFLIDSRNILGDECDGLIASLWPFHHEKALSWPHTRSTLARLALNGGIVTACLEGWHKYLPSYEEAETKINSLGFAGSKIRSPSATEVEEYSLIERAVIDSLYQIDAQNISSPYPLICGISDLVAVRREKLHQLAHVCGMFAALNIFVEIALPTALALVCETLKTADQLGFGFDWTYGLDPNYNTKKLVRFEDVLEVLNSMEQKTLFKHPIKLSKISM